MFEPSSFYRTTLQVSALFKSFTRTYGVTSRLDTFSLKHVYSLGLSLSSDLGLKATHIYQTTFPAESYTMMTKMF